MRPGERPRPTPCRLRPSATVGLGERAHDDDLVAVVGDVGRAREPAVGKAAGEPALELGVGACCVLPCFFGHGDYIITSLRRQATAGSTPATASASSSLVVTAAEARRTRAGRRLAVAGHRVHVEVRDALAHHVVHRHERALRAHRVLHRRRHRLGLREQLVAQRAVEVAQGRDVRRAASRACGPGTAAGDRGTRRRRACRAPSAQGTSPAMIEQKRHAPARSRPSARGHSGDV